MRRVRLISGSCVRAILLAALAPGLVASSLGASVFALRTTQAPTGAPPSVWDGVFTTDQAERGRRLFLANCAECHGDNLEGGEGKALTGDQFWADWKESTVGELLTFVRTNMPFSEDGSKKGTLPPSTYVDIVTHILKTNGFPEGVQELTPASSLGVRVIRREGPGELPASTLAKVVGCLVPQGAGGTWRLVMGTRPTRASSTGRTPDRDVALGDREYDLKFVLTSLTRLVGHRVAVTGLLIGEGGVNGLNVSSVDSVTDTCN